MKTLVIESATQACSTALFDDATCIAHFHEIIGRGHAERLVPAIAELPDKGRADRILVSLGPGSFTGVRIGLAAARALGLAWDVPVLGYPTLALVAARSGQSVTPRPVTVCMNGGHGEYFIQNFTGSTEPEDLMRALVPEQAAKACRHRVIAGDRATELAQLLGTDHLALDILPDARHALTIPEALHAKDLSPIYGRAPDAALPKPRKISAKNQTNTAHK